MSWEKNMTTAEEGSSSDDVSRIGSHSSEENSASSPSSTGMTSSTSKDGFVARGEERRITKAKFCFLFLLLAAAVAVGTTIYMITSNEEAEDFNTSVGDNSVFLVVS
jgi:hypothetical protein